MTRPSEGWLRLWALLTMAFVLYFSWLAWNDVNVREAEGSAWYCAPGTYESHVEPVPNGQSNPSQAAVAREEARLRAIGTPGDNFTISMLATQNLTENLYKDVTFFQCVSYGHVLSGILRGLLFSILVGALFVAARWAISGFRQKS